MKTVKKGDKVDVIKYKYGAVKRNGYLFYYLYSQLSSGLKNFKIHSV